MHKVLLVCEGMAIGIVPQRDIKACLRSRPSRCLCGPLEQRLQTHRGPVVSSCTSPDGRDEKKSRADPPEAHSGGPSAVQVRSTVTIMRLSSGKLVGDTRRTGPITPSHTRPGFLSRDGSTCSGTLYAGMSGQATAEAHLAHLPLPDRCQRATGPCQN
jgi:hypothetical protein